MTTEQIKDIVVALIEKGCVNGTSYNEVLNRTVQAIETLLKVGK